MKRVLRARSAVAMPAVAVSGVAVSAVLLSLLAGAGCARFEQHQAASKVQEPPAITVANILLLHGAFEDASAWDAVALQLRGKGYHVVAPDLPLTSLADDVAAARAAAAQLQGPMLLVGHSWGGTVITQMSADERVSGLIYVAGTAPEPGQSTSTLLAAYPSPVTKEIAPDTHGMVRVTEVGMCQYLAPGLQAGACQALASRQRPIASTAFPTPVTTAIPPNLPVWYIVAEQDRAVPPALQQALAERLHATKFLLQTGHDVPQAAPDEVARSIQAAEQQIGKAKY